MGGRQKAREEIEHAQADAFLVTSSRILIRSLEAAIAAIEDEKNTIDMV